MAALLSAGLGNHVSPTETLNVIKEDPDDDRILECAATAKSDFIVSEDKDLLRLGQFGNAQIVSVRDFINMNLPPASEIARRGYSRGGPEVK